MREEALQTLPMSLIKSQKANILSLVQVIREEIDTKWHKTRYVWTSVITAPWSPESGWTTWFCRASHVTSWDLPPKTTDLKRFLPFAAHATVTGSVVHDSTHTGINHGHGNTSYDTDHTHSDYSHGNSLPGTSHHAGHNNSSHSHSHGPSESTHHQLPTVTHSGPSTMATVPAFLNHAERMAELADLTEAQTAFKDASKGAKAGGIDVITYDGYLEYFDIHGLNRETEYGQSVARKFHMHDHNGDGVLTFEETQLLCDTDGCVNA